MEVELAAALVVTVQHSSSEKMSNGGSVVVVPPHGNITEEHCRRPTDPCWSGLVIKSIKSKLH